MIDSNWELLIYRLAEEGNYERLLGEVLAILNGDGGHYQKAHGVGNAVIHGLQRRLDLLNEIDMLKDALITIYRKSGTSLRDAELMEIK